jgi:hypothetical protein
MRDSQCPDFDTDDDAAREFIHLAFIHLAAAKTDGRIIRAPPTSTAGVAGAAGQAAAVGTRSRVPASFRSVFV